MRGLLPLLLVALLTPLAGAQTLLPEPSVTLEATGFAEPAPPEGGWIATPFVARVPCDLAGVAPETRIAYSIVTAPPWASVVVEPGEDSAPAGACGDGSVTFVGELRASVSTDAPAFHPAGIRLDAVVTQPHRAPATGSVEVPLHAGYVSMVDVVPKASALVLEPRELGAFVVRVTNLGNGPTRIAFDVEAQRGEANAQTPSPVTLGSRQAGATYVSHDVRFLVERIEAEPRPLAIVLRWHASYAFDHELRGDSGVLTLTLHPPGSDEELAASTLAEEIPARVPGPSLAVVLALVVGIALVARRASTRRRGRA